MATDCGSFIEIGVGFPCGAEMATDLVVIGAS
ncbi:unnamed protein product [Rhodiola kirilowii]